ncbi:hypothetical protein [Listeria seeligeri]|uniref:hypothetical protein n=1 Tax=Listeria seeligeri TaxID=1640 RepID=UPI0022EBCFD7|nr:hypothetical protein [Listeria seeligeri]
MNGFKAYEQMEQLSQLILGAKNAKPPFNIGTSSYSEISKKIETKWEEVSKCEYISSILDTLLSEIANYQDALYQEHKADFVRSILRYAGENDNYVLINPEISNVGFDLSSIYIQKNLLKWIQDEQIAKLVYFEYYKGFGFDDVLELIGLEISQLEVYQQLNDNGINALSKVWGVEKAIDAQLRIEKKCLEVDAIRGEF